MIGRQRAVESSRKLITASGAGSSRLPGSLGVKDRCNLHDSSERWGCSWWLASPAPWLAAARGLPGRFRRLRTGKPTAGTSNRSPRKRRAPLPGPSPRGEATRSREGDQSPATPGRLRRGRERGAGRRRAGGTAHNTILQPQLRDCQNIT
jgi:hypothetical protein